MLANPLKIVAGLFAAGLLACAPAHAANGSASASLNNIQFQLIDLDLTDNISPSLTFNRKLAYGGLDFYVAGAGSSVYSEGFESVSKVIANGGGSTRNEAGSMRAETHLDGFPGNSSASVYVQQVLQFTLSPSTRLLVTAQADAFLQQDGMDTSTARAIMGGEMRTVIGGVRGLEQFYASLSSAAGARSQFLQGILNTGAEGGTGNLYFNATTEFYNYADASPVPEPAGYAMLLAGLLVAGGVARRRRCDRAGKP